VFDISDLGTLDQVNQELLTRSEILLSFTEALAYKSQGDLDAAWGTIQRTIGSAEKISRTFAGKEAIYLLASQIQLGRKDYDAASEFLDQALRINPNYANGYLARGDLYYARASAANFDPSLLDAALTFYERAHDMPDQPVGAYIPLKARLGMANVIVIKAQQTQDRDLLQKAEEYYSDAINEYEGTLDPMLRPDAAVAYFGLGVIYEQQGKPEQALQEYQKAYSLADNEEFKANVQKRIQEIQK
jgi:tetratricopeptide (TPR) repeat protein